jgi:hypothetical protein
MNHKHRGVGHAVNEKIKLFDTTNAPVLRIPSMLL